LGYQIDQAPGGAEAVKAVKSATYDVVLMDVQMPGIDGLAATRMIRAMEGRADLPIVAMTAQALPEQIEQCRAAGMSDYLAKPITPASLVAVLDKWILGKHAAEIDAATNDESLSELREEFVAQCAKDLATIRALLDSPAPSAHQQLRDMLHRMAGTAGMVGFDRLSLDAKALEGELAHNATKDVSRGLTFLASLERVVRAA
jgi:CheY-like chemotaxis protein